MAQPVGMREAYEVSGYIKNLSSRLDNLKKTADESAKRIEQDGMVVDGKKEQVVKSLGEIKKDMVFLKDEMRSLQNATLDIINDLKSSVKIEEMERLKKRIDAWSPEALVSRAEAKKVVEKL